MFRVFIINCLLVFIFLGFCFEAFAAEVMQVSSSTVLLIGDNNRTYTVKISCIEVYPEKEELAFNWLRSELPRHTKINLRPKGSEQGVLLARVSPLGRGSDITKVLEEKGFAKNTC